MYYILACHATNKSINQFFASLYVTLEVQKFCGSMFLVWDLELEDEESGEAAKCNSSGELLLLVDEGPVFYQITKIFAVKIYTLISLLFNTKL